MGEQVVASVSDLDALPTHSVVESGSGLRYSKTENGWTAPFSANPNTRWLLNPDHTRQPVRAVTGVCVCCGRATRRQKSTLAEFPGTVRSDGDKCSSCASRRRPATEVALSTCRRCGYPVRGRDLCPDCWDVLGVNERAEWSA